jgi:hypothetical protein
MFVDSFKRIHPKGMHTWNEKSIQVLVGFGRGLFSTTTVMTAVPENTPGK